MKAIYNNEFIGDGDLCLTVYDRALQYGDGLFETIIIRQEQVNLIEYHHRRISAGAAVLCFELPEYLSVDYLKRSFHQLREINHLTGPLRFKVQVWRSAGGRYEPESASSNLLITVTNHMEGTKLLEHVGISKKIRNHYSVYSQFKTMNSLPYILASIEKKKAGHDDLVILDQNGFVSELLFSNIFWIREGIFHTPALNTGCIRGVMRSYVMDQCKARGISVKEVSAYPSELGRSEHIFATNAAGITHITGFNGRTFEIFQNIEEIVNL